MKLPAALVALVAVSVGVTLIVVSRGPDRSAQAVCHVWNTDGLALHNQFAAGAKGASTNPIDELGRLMDAPGQIADLMNQMAAVAPSNIEPDFSQLDTILRQTTNSKGLLSGLTNALTVSAEAEAPGHAINSFLASNCGDPSSTASSNQ